MPVKGQAEISFAEKSGLMYCLYKHPYVNGGKLLKQVMVPEKFETPHNGSSSWIDHGQSHGHQENNRQDPECILLARIQGDVTRFCKSCGVCQKTVSKDAADRQAL